MIYVNDGNIVACVLCHSFCNYIGPPDLDLYNLKSIDFWIVWSCYFLGFGLFLCF